MTLTNSPYLIIRTLERQLRVRDITYPWLVRFRRCQVRVGDRWITMDAGEIRSSSGSKPVRRMDLYAAGAEALAQVELEATLEHDGKALQLTNADQVVFEVGGTPMGSTLYLAGDFQNAHDPDWFPFRITLPDTTTIHGFALDQAWCGERVLALDDVSADDERDLIQAVVTSPTPLVVERQFWEEVTWYPRSPRDRT